MLLTKCFHDTTDFPLQVKSSSSSSSSQTTNNSPPSSGPFPLRTTTTLSTSKSPLANSLDIYCCCLLLKNAGLKCCRNILKQQRLRFRYNFLIFLLINLLLKSCCGQLLINVQNQGGEVIQESITSNVSEDLITLEFQKTDGTLITQIIDFRNEVRILKALVLGEEERGQNLYQVMCFVTKFQKGDFISSDAMAKLRQKNPSTIRTPEEDKGKETFTMTSWVHLNRSQPITRHLMSVCGEAVDATYVRDVDLKAWSELPGSSISSLEAATEKFPDTLSSRCNEVSSLWAPCICTLETCIGWYPCGLKYCKGKTNGDSSAAAAAQTNYRCGIKTCRKCSQFSYYVRQKQQCLWDE